MGVWDDGVRGRVADCVDRRGIDRCFDGAGVGVCVMLRMGEVWLAWLGVSGRWMSGGVKGRVSKREEGSGTGVVGGCDGKDGSGS